MRCGGIFLKKLCIYLFLFVIFNDLGYLEHAILLCNYFKFIELNNQNNQTESFVLIGNSIYGILN